MSEDTKNSISQDVLTQLREATVGTEFAGKLYLVGGYVRDKLMGRVAKAEDIDLVLEGSAEAVAWLLYRKKVAQYKPVLFPNFGTAMVRVGKAQVEIVTAREETYRQGSRQPIVKEGTLYTDALRRDFTVNTFMENLHTGEILDLTGQGKTDLEAGILRTPLDPLTTFTDDPLRMLRACRFAAKLGFAIASDTYTALRENAFRLSPEYGISYERIRDEVNKTLMASGAATGLEQMRETGLLVRFAPELVAMYGVTQNRFHKYDVWTHTLTALANLPESAGLLTRLAVLFHDIGKPKTRTVDTNGEVHFYEHETVGAEMAKEVMTRLRYSTDEIQTVGTLVSLHMRYGAYDAAEWTDAAVRRLIRTVGEHRQTLFTIAHADIAACNTDDFPTADLNGLQERMEQIEAEAHITELTSPLSGQEIMERLSLTPGRLVGRIKDTLTDAVVSGELAPDDKATAEAMAYELLSREKQ
jgi:putative nucleotidyltransferase with HDIG domain